MVEFRNRGEARERFTRLVKLISYDMGIPFQKICGKDCGNSVLKIMRKVNRFFLDTGSTALKFGYSSSDLGRQILTNSELVYKKQCSNYRISCTKSGLS